MDTGEYIVLVSFTPLRGEPYTYEEWVKVVDLHGGVVDNDTAFDMHTFVRKRLPTLDASEVYSAVPSTVSDIPPA